VRKLVFGPTSTFFAVTGVFAAINGHVCRRPLPV
jgi:hypothetical protein